MHRRKFLGTLAIGAGATALPVWLSRAFRPDERDCTVTADLGDLPGQLTDPAACLPGRAQGPLKPLLVFVIPTDDRAKFLRGQAFGELLNHGSDVQLAPLACFDVACRKLSELDPNWRGDPENEPLMVLVDRDSGALLPLDGPLPGDPEDFGSRPDGDVEARIDARIAALAALIAGAADGAHLTEQACRERAGLPPGDLRRLGELPHSLGELQPTDVDLAPATTTLLARSADAATREHLTALLAAAVRTRLCEQRIDGAPWARATGCGVVVEGEPRDSGDSGNSGIMCGMGFTPDRSRRFLKFFVSEY